jgi:hypothetical protein
MQCLPSGVLDIDLIFLFFHISNISRDAYQVNCIVMIHLSLWHYESSRNEPLGGPHGQLGYIIECPILSCGNTSSSLFPSLLLRKQAVSRTCGPSPGMKSGGVVSSAMVKGEGYLRILCRRIWHSIHKHRGMRRVRRSQIRDARLRLIFGGFDAN